VTIACLTYIISPEIGFLGSRVCDESASAEARFERWCGEKATQFFFRASETPYAVGDISNGAAIRTAFAAWFHGGCNFAVEVPQLHDASRIALEFRKDNGRGHARFSS